MAGSVDPWGPPTPEELAGRAGPYGGAGVEDPALRQFAVHGVPDTAEPSYMDQLKMILADKEGLKSEALGALGAAGGSILGGLGGLGVRAALPVAAKGAKGAIGKVVEHAPAGAAYWIMQKLFGDPAK